jgi:hypothetical protein
MAVLEQLTQLQIADRGQGGPLDHPHRIGAPRTVCLSRPGPMAIGSGQGQNPTSCRRRRGRQGGIKQADLAGDRLGGESVVAGHHRHPDARLAAAAQRLRHLRPGRIHQAHQGHEHQLPLQRQRRRGRRFQGLLRPDGPQGHRQHPLAPPGHGVVGRHHRGPGGGGEGFGSRRPELAAAALQQLQR